MIRILDPEPFLSSHEPFSTEQITENIVLFLYTFNEMYGGFHFDDRTELSYRLAQAEEIENAIAFTISMEE